MSIPKWTDERTERLANFVGNETPVSQETVADAAEQLETSTRSISSKLRKMGIEVAPAGRAAKAFSDAQEAQLRDFVESNAGNYTYAEIASAFEGGAFTSKQIQGKLLSMELTAAVKAAPPAEVKRAYTDEETSRFVELVNGGSSLEALAEAFNRPVNSVRGKALSLLREGSITAIPKQENTKAAKTEDPLSALGDVSEMTVEEIAAAIEKTPRGVKTMLTRRGINASDWKGADRAAKNAEASE